MALTLDDKLVVGISSRALFDLEIENEIFEKKGLKDYSEYQLTHENDVQEAINANVAAGIICAHADLPIRPDQDIDEIRIAFDGDAVIFSDEAEKIYKTEGLEAFARHEHTNAQKPLPEGPFAKLLKTISVIQQEFSRDEAPIRTALVTARNAPAHERVIRTLRAWDIRIDEAFFFGGIEKSEVLKAFGAHIFFDDQPVHTDSASRLVPAARVPLKKDKR